MPMLTLRINGLWTQWIYPLRNLVEFNTGGNMRGQRGSSPHAGRLPEDYRESFCGASYAVWSYGTPIAWFIPLGGKHRPPNGRERIADGWVMPAVSYSVTTTKQAGRVRTALSVLWDPAYDRDDAEPAPRPRRAPRIAPVTHAYISLPISDRSEIPPAPRDPYTDPYVCPGADLPGATITRDDDILSRIDAALAGPVTGLDPSVFGWPLAQSGTF